MKKAQPRKVMRIVCPKCGELMAKIFPWSSISVPEGAIIRPCGACQNRSLKSGVAQ